MPKQQTSATIFSSDTAHSVGLEEIEALKDQANKIYQEGKFSQAVIGYSYALKQLATMLVPRDRQAMISMENATQVSQAIRSANVSSKGKAVSTALFNNRAAAYLKLQRFEKAAQDAGAAATIDPENFKAWLRKATAHKELGQWYECNQAVKKALSIDSEHPDVLQMLEESQFKMGAGMPTPAFNPAAEAASTQQRRKKFGVF